MKVGVRRSGVTDVGYFASPAWFCATASVCGTEMLQIQGIAASHEFQGLGLHGPGAAPLKRDVSPMGVLDA